jgi:transcriptional regulator with XRE-family HTH domain
MARKKHTEIEIEITKNVARNIKRILDRQNISQKELAEKTNLATSTISDYVNARTLISPGNLQKVADALNVSKSDIDPSIGEIEEPKDPDIRTLHRAAKEMTPDQRKKAIKILEATFEDLFDGKD